MLNDSNFKIYIFIHARGQKKRQERLDNLMTKSLDDLFCGIVRREILRLYSQPISTAIVYFFFFKEQYNNN